MSSLVSEASSDARNQSDPYFFYVTGLREPYSNWKRFKDLIRSLIPSNNPGWTNMGPQPVSPSREHWAYFSAKSWADAYAAFSGLASLRQKDGTHIGVHLIDTTGNNGPNGCAYNQLQPPTPQYAVQGATPVGSGMHAMNANPVPYPYQSNALPYPPAPQYVQTPTIGYLPATQAHWMPTTGAGVATYMQPVQCPTVQNAAPCYVHNTNGLPINVSNGAYVTESRAVLITNLSYSTKEADLASLLGKVVSASRIDLATDTKGKNKGSAVAYFATAAEAQRVIKKLNNVKLAGKHLHMRADKNVTATRSTSSSSVVIIDSSSS